MISRPANRSIAVLGAALILVLGAPPLQAREPGAPPKVVAQHIETKPLAGEPGKEIDIQVYTFPPRSAVPWHIHKDAVEIEYGLAGTLMIEEQGKPPYALEAGKTNILAPNAVHRGWNPSTTDPVKIYVVRIKPAGAPLATLVDAPKAAPNAKDAPNAPDASTYPEDERPGAAP